MVDIRKFDLRALKITEASVEQVQLNALDGPTPCAKWTLRKLLEHMIGLNYGFATAARGQLHDKAVWADRPFGDHPAGPFADSAAAVAAAFAEDGVLDREFWLPEVRGGQMFPASTAIGFHFVDCVVHGWDVARAIGVSAEFDADLLEAVLPYAEEVPDGANRRQADASFQPGLPTMSTATLDRVLVVLGRSPEWPD